MVEDKLVLAIDQGTTGSAAILFTSDGRVKAEADREFPQIYPQPGWVEHDPEAIWETTRRVIREALDLANVDAGDLQAVGITNQRETTLAWDARTGKPLANAIVWQDRRTAPRCERLTEDGWAPTIRRKTGLVIDAYFSGTKMAWLRENVDAVRDAEKAGTLRFGTIDAWLVWKLTDGGRFATDATNASRTLLYDINRHRWDEELAEELGIPLDALPEVVDSSGLVAETSASAFGASVPIAGIAGDQQAALFGQACFRKGRAKNTYGTGSFVLMNTGAERAKSKRLLSTVAWRREGQTEYALEGSIFTTGASVQWLRDGLGFFADAAESEALAESVDDTGDVFFVPALSGLGAPHWDMYARGALIGLTRGTTRAHITRAVLEATAYRTKDVLDAMVEDSGVPVKTLRVDGGGSMNRFLMQFQADMLGVPVERPVVSETTAQGAAFLAGLATDVWASPKEIEDRWALDARFDPLMDPKSRETKYARWLEALERGKGWAPQ